MSHDYPIKVPCLHVGPILIFIVNAKPQRAFFFFKKRRPTHQPWESLMKPNEPLHDPSRFAQFAEANSILFCSPMIAAA